MSSSGIRHRREGGNPACAALRVALVIAAGMLAGCMSLGRAAMAVPGASVLLPHSPVREAGEAPGTLAQPRDVPGDPRIALALGSGSLRGYAHVGVLAALEEAGIRPGLIVGASAGSMVGALAASGLTAAQVEQASRELGWNTLADFALPRRGLLGGDGVESFMRRHLGGRSIEALPTAFAAVATDARTGDAVILNSGDTATAVRASSSIPALFEPVSARGRMLVDGSLAAPTPVRIARALGADVVIAVNVAWSPEEGSPFNPLAMLFQAMQVMAHNLNRAELALADVVIAPDIRRLGSIGNGSRSDLIRLGEEAGRAATPSIRESIRAWRAARAVAGAPANRTRGGRP